MQKEISDYTNQFTKMRANNIIFLFCCDEWTSLDNKIYFNLTLFTSNNTYNLGLTRIRGNFDATTGLELIKEKLEEFGINYASHIVAMTSDGAAVMKKLGRIAPFEMQTYINHGIHLAVNDSLTELDNSTAVDN